MSGVGMLLTHSIARREGKLQFFFSRYNFQSMRERGNTHYCFYCIGDWGFTPGKDGEPTNHLDDKIWIRVGADEFMRNADVLKDSYLESQIVDSKGSPRHKPGDAEYVEWLKMIADLKYSPELEAWCVNNGYAIFRWNPMDAHDPVTHANGIVGGADKFDSAYAWLEASLPEDFPLFVSIT